MKALKLKGWVDGILGHRPKAEIATAHWFAVKPVPDMVRATLVIGDERMFTESEVRAILRDLLAAAEDGPFMPNYDRMDEMVKFHGLSFDPA